MDRFRQQTFKIWVLPLLFIWAMTPQYGDAQNLKTLYNGQRKGELWRVIPNKNGDFVSVGTIKKNGSDLHFTVVSAADKTLTDTAIDSLGGTGGNSLIQTHDDNYLIAGFKFNENYPQQDRKVALLVKVNAKGQKLWHLKISSKGSGVFTDIVEAPNGTIWLTGQSNGKLWVVKVEENGKTYRSFFYESPNGATFGNAMAWSADNKHLVIIGTQIQKKQYDLLLVTFDTEGGYFVKEKTKIEPKAEGNGIVRDKKGGFGIIGTSHERTKSDILFAYYDVALGVIKNKKQFGRTYFDDRGSGITQDTEGNFVLVGEFYENEGDTKSQAWLHKVSENGQSIGTPMGFGGDYDDAFQTVHIAQNNELIVAGSKDGKAWLVAITPPSVNLPNQTGSFGKVNWGTGNDNEKTTLPPTKRREDTPPVVQSKPTRIIWAESNNIKIVDEESVVYVYNNIQQMEVEIVSSHEIDKKIVHLLVNGVDYYKDSRADNVRLDTLSAIDKDYPFRYVYKPKISLGRKITTIQIKVEEKLPVFSEHIRLEKKEQPNLHLLAVGVSYEKNSQVRQLIFTDEDARSIGDFVKTQDKFFNEMDTVVLTNKAQTDGSIIKAQIKRLGKNSKESDVTLLYLSGHGILIKGGKRDSLIFLANDYDPNNPDTYLDFEKDIEAPLRRLKGHKFVFIDACQDIYDYRGVRNTDPEGFRKAWLSMESKANFSCLLSCSPGQLSYENGVEWKHGAFTLALLEAFENKEVPYLAERTDKLIRANPMIRDYDEFLTLQEISDFVSRRVPYLVKDQKGTDINQNPILGGDKFNNNMPIFHLRKY